MHEQTEVPGANFRCYFSRRAGQLVLTPILWHSRHSMATASGITPPKPNGRIAFTYPSFTLYQVARFFVVLATEMQSVAVGWQVYEITRRPLDLGLVGLAQFLPGIIFLPLSGHTADRYHRSKVLTVGYVALAFCSALLLSITLRGTRMVYPIYVAVGLIGVARAFTGPASRAILPQLIPEEHFESAFAWGATFFEIATILGPAVGGLVYTIFRGPAAVYAV
ncbi:MAG: MFS transporter, partial [Candidatus Acidiferrales bacterium]